MSAAEARAFWIVAVGQAEIRRESLPVRQADEVVVAAHMSAVSRGTETLVFRGRVPVSQHQAMRGPHQAGAFTFPIKYGYSSVGQVVQGPRDLVGQRVFCLYPHQDRYVVPRAAVVTVPDGVPDRRAVLAANMETAINGLWDAGPRIGDRIAVVGGGVVGMLVATLAAGLPGATVQLVDVDPAKAAVARALGLAFALPGEAEGEADLVFHASGSSEGLATALGLAGFEAMVLELSWYGDRTVQAPLGEAFHSRRLRLVASQVGAVAGARRARWDHRRRLGLALDLLTDARYDALLAPPVPLADLPATMATLAAGPSAVMCQLVDYRLDRE